MATKETQPAGAGDDTLAAAGGDDTLKGGAGDDTATGGGSGGGGGNETLEITVGAKAAEAPSLADPTTLGFAKMKHPSGSGGASWGGQSYEADEAGFITVPLQAVEDLASHGFVLA